MDNENQGQTTEENEEETATILSSEQELNIARENLQKKIAEGELFKKPSKLKYAFLFTVAGIIDVIDVLDVTGVGIIISKIVSIGGTGIIYFTLWLTDTQLKKAHKYEDDLSMVGMGFEDKIQRYSRLAMKTSKKLAKIPGLKGVARKIPRTLVKLRRVARKNPITKVLLGGVINLVPFLAIINLMVVWIYLVYRDEKKAFKKAREAAQEAMEQVKLI